MSTARPRILLSHPMGNANLRAVATALHARGLLESFHTSIATYPGNRWDRLSALGPLSDFGRRAFDPALAPLTHQYPGRELLRMVASKAGLHRLTAHETGRYSVDAIYHAHDRRVADYLRRGRDADQLGGVYAYEDGALETFRAARERGLQCIYDLPIAYWATARRLQEEEARRLPRWAPTLGGGIGDSEEKLARKRAELELADVVVGPGSFVMDSLPDWAADRARIVAPFGSPQTGDRPARTDYATPGGDRPLRVLFVGSMGQRKGLGDLFAAMRKLAGRPVELVVLGSQLAPEAFYRGEYAGFTYEPTRSHAGVLELMRSCDVFCLPSIVEGRALVMQEAMSQGLPIVITANTGGADLVVAGETGFLVPIRDPEAIADRLAWFDDHRGELPRMGAAAAAHAARYTWAAYGNHVATEIGKRLQTADA